MSKLVRIYNLNVDKYGEPFAICAKHLKELEHRLGDHTFTTVIGTTKEICGNCND